MTSERLFDALQSQDIRNERRIFWSEIAVIVVVALLAAGYLAALWLTSHPASIAPVSTITSQFAIGRAVSEAL